MDTTEASTLRQDSGQAGSTDGGHSTGRRGRRRLILLFASIIGIGGLALTTTTNAFFARAESSPGNLFTTGTLDLAVTEDGTVAYVPFDVTSLAPGDTVYKAVMAKNTGSLDLRYAITSTPTAISTASGGVQDGVQLLKELTTTIKTGLTASGCEALTESGGAAWTGATTVLAPTASTLGGAAPAVNTVANLLGDPAQGSHPGDRTLTGGSGETLCLQVALPLTSTNATQGSSATMTFGFLGEQTKNNP